MGKNYSKLTRLPLFEFSWINDTGGFGPVTAFCCPRTAPGQLKLPQILSNMLVSGSLQLIAFLFVLLGELVQFFLQQLPPRPLGLGNQFRPLESPAVRGRQLRVVRRFHQQKGVRHTPSSCGDLRHLYSIMFDVTSRTWILQGQLALVAPTLCWVGEMGRRGGEGRKNSPSTTTSSPGASAG